MSTTKQKLEYPISDLMDEVQERIDGFERQEMERELSLSEDSQHTCLIAILKHLNAAHSEILKLERAEFNVDKNKLIK